MSAPIDNDQFKIVFKYFKRRKPPADLSNVIDFRLYKSDERIQVLPVKLECNISHIICAKFGLKPVQDWKAYTLSDIQGFIFIQNPFITGYQRYWIHRCLKDLPKKPNICNLDAHISPNDKDYFRDKKHNICNLDAHISLNDKDYFRDKKPGKSSSACLKDTDMEKSLNKQLRWVTLGYHHNWDTKVYKEDHHSPFPSDLAGMTELIAAWCGYDTFMAQAAIVNYYHLDSTLGGHTDHSEFDLDMPIISYSFGQSAIFLLGGATKEQTPTPMFLHTGDIIIMGGPSRLAYHAVPKVLCYRRDGQLPECLDRIPETLTSVDPSKNTDISPRLADFKCTICSRHGNPSMNKFGVSTVEQHRLQTLSCCHDSLQDCQSTTLQVSSSHDIDKADVKSLLGKKRGMDTASKSSQKNTGTSTGPKLICKEQGYRLAGKCNNNNSNICQGSCSHLHVSSHKTSEDNEIAIDSQMRILCCQDNWDPIAQYLRDSRINVSVRQVTKAGQGFPDVEKESEATIL